MKNLTKFLNNGNNQRRKIRSKEFVKIYKEAKIKNKKMN